MGTPGSPLCTDLPVIQSWDSHQHCPGPSVPHSRTISSILPGIMGPVRELALLRHSLLVFVIASNTVSAVRVETYCDEKYTRQSTYPESEFYRQFLHHPH